MAKKTKAPTNKEVLKMQVSEIVAEFLKEKGYTVDTDYEKYNFTKGTVVVSNELCSLQVKFLSPKSTLEFYEPVNVKEEEEENCTTEEEKTE